MYKNVDMIMIINKGYTHMGALFTKRHVLPLGSVSSLLITCYLLLLFICIYIYIFYIYVYCRLKFGGGISSTT
jgi:hypothetical protein